jgi:hypothetical protein
MHSALFGFFFAKIVQSAGQFVVSLREDLATATAGESGNQSW